MSLPGRHHPSSLTRLLLAVAVVCLFAVAAGADEDKYKAQDFLASDTALISTADLVLRLNPLRRDELEAEVDKAVDRLEEKMTVLAEAQITSRTAEGDEKANLDQQVAELSAAKLAMIDRVNLIIAAFEAKGGDAEEHTQYVAAVSGADVDLTDASATWVYLSNWVQSPEGGIRVGFNIMKFLVTVLVFWIVARILAGIVRRALDRLDRASSLLRQFLVNATRRSTFVIGLVVAVSMLGVNIGPLMAAIGAAGLVIGLALQGTLSNFASGLLILIYRPFDVGDWITVAGKTGKVDSMTLVTTTLISADNQKIIIPNNGVWGDVITNITGRPTRRVDMVFGIGYSDDIDRAKEVLGEILSGQELVMSDPAPVIQVHELADSSVNFVVRPWAKTSDYWAVYWSVHAEVKRRFDAENIGIPFPQMDVHLINEATAS